MIHGAGWPSVVLYKMPDALSISIGLFFVALQEVSSRLRMMTYPKQKRLDDAGASV